VAAPCEERTAFVGAFDRVENRGQSQKKRVSVARAARLCHGTIDSLVLGTSSANGRVTQALLGHADAGTTQIYTGRRR
jgi:site-specific recombinase XerC